MIGTRVQPRRPRITSMPSMPGRPRSRITSVGMMRAPRASSASSPVAGEVDVVAAGPEVRCRGPAGSAARRRRRGSRVTCAACSARRPSVQPAAGGVLELELAAHRLDEALGDGEAEPDPVAVRRCRRAAGTARTPRRARRAGCPGRGRRRARRRRRRPRPPRRAPAIAGRRARERVGDEVGDRPLEQRRVGDDRRQRLGDVDVDRARRARRGWRARRARPRRAPTARSVDVERAGLEPAHVEQVADEAFEPVGLLVDRVEELAGAARRPVDVVAAAGSSTDALIDASGVRRSCETAAGAPCAARWRRRASPPRRPRPRAPRAAIDDGELARERVEDALVVAARAAPHRRARARRSSVEPRSRSPSGVAGTACPPRASTRPVRRRPGGRAATAVEPNDARGGRRAAVGHRRRRRRARGERLGLGAGPGGLGRAARGRATTSVLTTAATARNTTSARRFSASAIVKRVERRREEPVDEQEPGDRRSQRRPRRRRPRRSRRRAAR